jgi:hypothetical protein
LNLLSDFRAEPPAGEKPTKRTSIVEIRDDKTKQALIVQHDGQLDAFNFDVEEAGWKEGEAHTDGVLIGEVDDEIVVVFIELTGRVTDEAGLKETPAEHKLRQLVGAANHFHPTGRGTKAASHGALHHDQFANGTDAVSPKPSLSHRVLGIVVANRQGSRVIPTPIRIGTTVMKRQFRQVSRERLTARITFKDLVRPPT